MNPERRATIGAAIFVVGVMLTLLIIFTLVGKSPNRQSSNLGMAYRTATPQSFLPNTATATIAPTPSATPKPMPTATATLTPTPIPVTYAIGSIDSHVNNGSAIVNGYDLRMEIIVTNGRVATLSIYAFSGTLPDNAAAGIAIHYLPTDIQSTGIHTFGANLTAHTYHSDSIAQLFPASAFTDDQGNVVATGSVYWVIVKGTLEVGIGTD